MGGLAIVSNGIRSEESTWSASSFLLPTPPRIPIEQLGSSPPAEDQRQLETLRRDTSSPSARPSLETITQCTPPFQQMIQFHAKSDDVTLDARFPNGCSYQGIHLPKGFLKLSGPDYVAWRNKNAEGEEVITIAFFSPAKGTISVDGAILPFGEEKVVQPVKKQREITEISEDHITLLLPLPSPRVPPTAPPKPEVVSPPPVLGLLPEVEMQPHEEPQITVGKPSDERKIPPEKTPDPSIRPLVTDEESNPSKYTQDATNGIANFLGSIQLYASKTEIRDTYLLDLSAYSSEREALEGELRRFLTLESNRRGCASFEILEDLGLYHLKHSSDSMFWGDPRMYIYVEENAKGVSHISWTMNKRFKYGTGSPVGNGVRWDQNTAGWYAQNEILSDLSKLEERVKSSWDRMKLDEPKSTKPPTFRERFVADASKYPNQREALVGETLRYFREKGVQGAGAHTIEHISGTNGVSSFIIFLQHESDSNGRDPRMRIGLRVDKDTGQVSLTWNRRDRADRIIGEIEPVLPRDASRPSGRWDSDVAGWWTQNAILDDLADLQSQVQEQCAARDKSGR